MHRTCGKWNKLFELPSGRMVRHSWTTERGGRPVGVSMVRATRHVRGRWYREVYAFAGVTPEGVVSRWDRASYYRSLMRRRYGIETSYRQMNQGKALTTSTDPRHRLLWMGVALWLRQVWVWCQRAIAGRRTNWSGWRPAEELRWVVLLAWLAGRLQQHYPTNHEIQLPQPVTTPLHHTSYT